MKQFKVLVDNFAIKYFLSDMIGWQLEMYNAFPRNRYLRVLLFIRLMLGAVLCVFFGIHLRKLCCLFMHEKWKS
jgi:hypothetical protein